jgi:hypothetical protein
MLGGFSNLTFYLFFSALSAPPQFLILPSNFLTILSRGNRA